MTDIELDHRELTLRDRFALASLAIMVNEYTFPWTESGPSIVRRAYELADLMLAERTKELQS